MSSVRSVLGVALLLTGTSAATAQYNSPPATNQVIQVNASTTVDANANVPVTDQALQANASAAIEPAVNQSSKPRYSGLWCDNSDQYGGHGPNTLWGMRTFWDNQSSD